MSPSRSSEQSEGGEKPLPDGSVPSAAPKQAFCPPRVPRTRVSCLHLLRYFQMLMLMLMLKVHSAAARLAEPMKKHL